MFDFGMRLQQLRMGRNLSQAALGKKLNRSKSVICAYENNLRIPPLEVLTDIAVFFNVSLDYLVGIDKEEMISIEGLTDEQKEIVHSLIFELRVQHRIVLVCRKNSNPYSTGSWLNSTRNIVNSRRGNGSYSTVAFSFVRLLFFCCYIS